MATSGTAPQTGEADSQLQMRAEIKDWRASHPRRWGRRTLLGVLRLVALGICVVLVFVVLVSAVNVATDAMHVTQGSAPRQR